MRKLASVRAVDAVRPIEGADSIECAVVGGWTVVVKKGEFQAGDLAVFCEIDSWVPTDLAPFLTAKNKAPREFGGVKGERLVSVRLRGQLSQGLLLPLLPACQHVDGELAEGRDVSVALGVKKWVATTPAILAGKARGNFPPEVPKTEQERCQNMVKKIFAPGAEFFKYEITEKLEGTSCTFYLDNDGVFHACSRNMDLQQDENNAYWKAAEKYKVEQSLRAHSLRGFAIQGELIGPKINCNIYNLTEAEFYVFDIYDVNRQCYLRAADRRHLARRLGLQNVPVVSPCIPDTLVGDPTDTLILISSWMSCRFISTIDQLLAFAEGKSALNPAQEREGLVFREAEGGMSFKVINNKYLLNSKQ
jgi:RNA ligase (TIGR02306 family)